MFRDFDIKTKDNFTIGLIAQRHFKLFSLIFNCENLSDIRQTRFENTMIPPVEAPSFIQI